jgi:hypothetical protein
MQDKQVLEFRDSVTDVYLWHRSQAQNYAVNKHLLILSNLFDFEQAYA